MASGTTAQLIINTSALVTLGTDDMQTTGGEHLIVALLPVRLDAVDTACIQTHVLRHLGTGISADTIIDQGCSRFGFSCTNRCQLSFQTATEHDIGSTTRHVGRDGHRARAPGVLDDACFALVLLGVQDFVRDVLFLEKTCQIFTGLDRGGSNQNRLTLFNTFLDVLNDRVVLFALGEEDKVCTIITHHRAVCGYDNNLKPIDLLEFKGLGVSRTRHSCELVVEAEVVLVGDGGERLVLALDFHTLFCLDCLMQPIGPATSRHGSPGELVNDNDLTVLDDVVNILGEQRMRSQGRIEMMEHGDIGRVIQACIFIQYAFCDEQVLKRLHTLFGQVYLLAFLINRIIPRTFFFLLALKLWHHGIEREIERAVSIGRTGDNQGCARLIDEDRVHFIDYRKVQFSLDFLLNRVRHVVAQVVKTKLVIGAVGHVTGVGVSALLRGQATDDDANAQAEKVVELGHPLRVTTSEIVVDRDDVYTSALQRVEIYRGRGDQRFTFTSAHLGNLAVVEHHAADQLHIEVAHAERPAASLAGNGKGFWKHGGKLCTTGQTLAQLGGLGRELLVGERLETALQRVDGVDLSA